MGRSNAAGQQAAFAPVDHYRKQLGREAHKVEKKAQRAVHKRIASKVDRASGTKTGFLLIALLLVVLMAAYLLVYVGLKYEDERVEAFVLALKAFIANYELSHIAISIAVAFVAAVGAFKFAAYKFGL
uniref:Triple QxxK/R motif-containing protein n=1 Tax=Plectus sambesii TaxID=2011161 RepID=A0A914UI56_9BILA